MPRFEELADSDTARFGVLKNAWNLLHSHPPALVRLFARRRTTGKAVRVLAIEEIAIVSGLPLDRVIAISQQTEWDGITIPEAERFVKACGFDPLSSADRNRKGAYFYQCKKKPPSHRFKYLQTDARWTTEFLPLIKRLQSRTGF